MLAKKYQSLPNAIASYDFQDIASGNAYETFYGGVVSGSTLQKNILMPNTFYSQLIAITVQNTSDVPVAVLDEDFDVNFNIPRIIEGDAIVNITYGLNTFAASGTYSTKVVAELLKNGIHIISGSTAIASIVTVSNAPFSRVTAIHMDMPRTSLSIGDELTLNVELWGWRTAGTVGCTWGIGTSPMNRSFLDGSVPHVISGSVGHPTSLTLHIPFVPDL